MLRLFYKYISLDQKIERLLIINLISYTFKIVYYKLSFQFHLDFQYL